MRVSVSSLAALAAVSACASLTDPVPPSGGSPPPSSGLPAAAVSGRVLSKELGVMAGIHVIVEPAGESVTTASDGQWQVAKLVPGPISVRLTGLPPECTNPGVRTADPGPGATVRIRFLVDCSGSAEDGTNR